MAVRRGGDRGEGSIFCERKGAECTVFFRFKCKRREPYGKLGSQMLPMAANRCKLVFSPDWPPDRGVDSLPDDDGPVRTGPQKINHGIEKRLFFF